MKKLFATTLFLIAAIGLPTLGTAKNTSKNKAGGSSRPVAARIPVQGPAYATREDVMRWADDMASRRDLDRDWVRQAIGQAHFLPGVPRLMLPPPTGTAKNWRRRRAPGVLSR